MKYVNYINLAIVSLCLAACAQNTSNGPSLSDLKFESYENELGSVYQQHTYDLEFVFEVVGNDPITIDEIDVSCGCTSVVIYPAWDTDSFGEVWPLGEPIPAGVTGSIRAVFDGSRYKGDKASTITLKGNFLERKTALGVKAFVKPVFDISPQNINFGEVLTSLISTNTPEKIITVVAMKDYEIKRWLRVPKGIVVEAIGDVTQLEGESVSRQYRISVNSSIPAGPMASSVDAETSIGVNLEFTVAARVLGPVRYSPSQRVAFGMFDEGQSRQRSVKLEATSALITLPKPTAEIVGGAAGAIAIEQIKSTNDGKGYEIKMRIPETVPPGNYNGLLKITYPNNPEFEAQEVILNARIRKK
ncbi:MAG: hypothetical protein ACI84O_001069 [Myxococcota bacterium]|jgi:hypothetical protein